MKEYVLSYYQNFKCIANECKHTCCTGWDMYIDRDTLSDYKNLTADYSKTLKSGIDFKKSKFKTNKGRCAFLNSDGLCDIILNLGEQKLCQICRDHPRFKVYYDNVVETGLGFCCEKATEIILSYQDKITPVLISDDKSEIEPSFIRQEVLKFRKQALDIVQDRNKDINERIGALLSLCRASVKAGDFLNILNRFYSLERLDKTWGKRLKRAKTQKFSHETTKELSLYCEQFLANSFYRHLAQAEDTAWARAIAIACIFAWWVIKTVYDCEKTESDGFEIVCDIVRDYSGEVEYSVKNLQKLFSFANKFVKI